jgi:phosphatidylglycerol:prolipoprotein diacylglycerol transferase
MDADWGYRLIMGSAMVAAYLVSRATQQNLGIGKWHRWGVLLGAFCGAMIGAKLPYLFVDMNEFLAGTTWFQNGKTILCGLVGGYGGVEIAKWCMDIKTKTGDSFAVPVAVGIAVGRFGCFHAGCCFGTPTGMPWGVVFPAIDHLPRHPTQIYEAVFHFGAAVCLWLLLKQQLFRGNLIKLYIISYAIYRLFTETIRPEPRLWLGLTAYQLGSIAIIVLFAALWYRDASVAKAAASVGRAEDLDREARRPRVLE